MKRPIKSHKGGRTANLLVRLEPEVKAYLDAKTESVADWITAKVKEEQQKKKEEG